MIAAVRGEVMVRRPDHVVVDAGGVGYRLADWVSTEAGGRIARQQFQNDVTIPFTYGVFVAVIFGLVEPLVRGP